MTIAVAVRKGGEIVIAADTQNNFGHNRAPIANHRTQKILTVGGNHLATSGWGLYANILDDFLARKRAPKLDTERDVFRFFQTFWKALHEHYSLVNDQCQHEEERSPFGDLDASFLLVNGGGIFFVSSDTSVTELPAVLRGRLRGGVCAGGAARPVRQRPGCRDAGPARLRRSHGLQRLLRRGHRRVPDHGHGRRCPDAVNGADRAGLLARLATTPGCDWRVDPDAMAPYLAEQRGLYRGAALAVALPQDTAAVSALVRACAQLDLALVPQGGNTGLCGGAVAQDAARQVVVSLERLDRIRAIDPANFTLTAEAGCIVQRVREAAADENRLFPLSFGADASARLGGALSTNAGGTNVLRYGNARELTLGLEVVLADGQVWDGLTALRKDNTGYDLKQLFIGAEGTLGIITAAVVKLFPLPRETVTAWLACPSVEACVAVFGRLRDASGDAVTGCELLSRTALDFVLRHLPGAREPLDAPAPWYLLVELTSSSASRRSGDGARNRARTVPGQRPDQRRRRCRQCAPGGGLLAPARGRGRGAAPRGRQHQERRGGAGVGRAGVRCRGQCGGAGRLSGAARVRLRPHRRRQPAFQPVAAAGAHGAAVPCAMGHPDRPGQCRGCPASRFHLGRARHRPAKTRCPGAA